MAPQTKNLPAKAEPTLPGLVPSRGVQDIIDQFHVFQEGREVLINRLPTAGERRALQARRDDMHVKLRGFGMSTAEMGRAQMELAAFIGSFSVAQSGGYDLDGAVAAYIIQLKDMPISTLLRALDDIRNNRVRVAGKNGDQALDRDMPPAAFRILDVCKAILKPIHDERAAIERVMSATKEVQPEVSEAERKRIGEKMAGLKLTLQDGVDRAARPDRERITKAAAVDVDKMRLRQDDDLRRQYEALGAQPQYCGGSLMSPALAMKMGLIPRPRRETGEDR